MITKKMEKEVKAFVNGKTLYNIHETSYEDLSEQNIMDLYRAIQYIDDLILRYFPEAVRNKTSKSNRKQQLKRVLSYWLGARRDEKDPCEFLYEYLEEYRHYGSESKEKLMFFYGEERGTQIYNEKREAFKGENNPAYQHGGKFSPFSKKFVSYENMDEDEKVERIRDVAGKAQMTMSINSTAKLQPDYWMVHYGYSYEDAVKKISELQDTRSLESFIERYGEEEGFERFNETIEKWLDSFWNQKTDEEKKDIVLGKRKGMEKARSNHPDSDAVLYFVKLNLVNGDVLYKVGKTSDLQERLRQLKLSKDVNDVEIVTYFTDKYKYVSEAEEAVVDRLWGKNTLLNEKYKDFDIHKVETFELDEEEVKIIKEVINEYAEQ